MRGIFSFIKGIWDRIFARKPGVATATTIPAPKPIIKRLTKRQERIARRMAISHLLRCEHFGTFSPIRPVGRGANRQRVRPVCSTRAFKDAFFRDYGVRLT